MLYDQFGVARQLVKERDGSMGFLYSQDCNAILEDNKKKLNPGVHGYRKNMLGGKHLATIPIGIIYEALKKYGIPAGQFMRFDRKEQFAFYNRIYQDPDYMYQRAS